MNVLLKSEPRKSQFFREKGNHLRCKYLTNRYRSKGNLKRVLGRNGQFLVVKVINLFSRSLKNIFPAHY